MCLFLFVYFHGNLYSSIHGMLQTVCMKGREVRTDFTSYVAYLLTYSMVQYVI